MRKFFKSGLVLAMVLAFGVTSAHAADRIKKRDTKKDGSCQSYTVESNDMTLAATQKRLRDGSGTGTPDRKRDGSCQSYEAPVDGDSLLVAAQKRNGTGKGSQDRLRDGSCKL